MTFWNPSASTRRNAVTNKSGSKPSGGSAKSSTRALKTDDPCAITHPSKASDIDVRAAETICSPCRRSALAIDDVKVISPGFRAATDMLRDTTSPASATSRWIRSEEHTSALQSLMRFSYAAFCLKNKQQQH